MPSYPGRLTAPSVPGGQFAERGKDLSRSPFTLHVSGISRFFLKPCQQLYGLFILTLPQNIKQTAEQPPGSTDLLPTTCFFLWQTKEPLLAGAVLPGFGCLSSPACQPDQRKGQSSRGQSQPLLLP